MKKSTLFVVFVLAAFMHCLLPHVVAPASLAQTPPQTSNLEERIARIEHGLLPPVLVKGEPRPGMNLVDRMNFYKVPGVSIAVIDQGRIAWSRGYGFADTAAKRPVTPETRFQAASISKSVAATAALHFVEEGKFDLDRNVNDYLKSWKVPENEFTRASRRLPCDAF
jgi:CubicO group peptidase (beta-lactamase class C family)